MKKFTFENGEVRLESQIREGRDFKTACVLWGTFDKETGEPLKFSVSEATEQELEEENERLLDIQDEFDEITEYNNRVNLGNEKLANATNIDEFLNAYQESDDENDEN